MKKAPRKIPAARKLAKRKGVERRKSPKARKVTKRDAILRELRAYIKKLENTPKPLADPPKRSWGGVPLEMVMRARARGRRVDPRPITVDQMIAANHPASVFPGGVRPANAAMDDAINTSLAWVQTQMGSAVLEGTTFLGYAYLAILTQRPEYRRISEVIATEMTRRWIKFSSNGGEDKSEKIKQLEEELDRLKCRDVFRELAEQDGFFGRSHLYLDLGTTNDREELKTSIGDGRSFLSRIKVQPGPVIAEAPKPPAAQGAESTPPADPKPEAAEPPKAAQDFSGATPVTISKPAPDGETPPATEEEKPEPFPKAPAPPKRKPGNLQALRTVEAVWCYPTNYGASDPLKPDWYKPSSWFVQGKEVHSSRLLTFVGREVPDLLKPAYSFGGLALSQMAKPYVDNWLQTRQSVADLIKSFTVWILKTNMAQNVAPGGQELFNRIDLFNLFRANSGAFVVDKETEEFENVSVPLGSLDALQAQAQEHMASVSGIPLVKLLGIQPAGLNASSEGEIRVFYDWVNAYQESFFRRHLTTVIDFAQLNIWGEVDPDITFQFVHLWSLNEKEQAEVDKMRAETGLILIDAGVIEAAEERKRVATAPESVYASIDVNAVPEPEMSPEEMAALMGLPGEEDGAPAQLGGEEEGDGEGDDDDDPMRPRPSAAFTAKKPPGTGGGWSVPPGKTGVKPPKV